MTKGLQVASPSLWTVLKWPCRSQNPGSRNCTLSPCCTDASAIHTHTNIYTCTHTHTYTHMHTHTHARKHTHTTPAYMHTQHTRWQIKSNGFLIMMWFIHDFLNNYVIPKEVKAWTLLAYFIFLFGRYYQHMLSAHMMKKIVIASWFMSGLITDACSFYLHYCKTLSSNTINAPALVIVNAQVQTLTDVH